MAEFIKKQVTNLLSVNSEFPTNNLVSVWSSYDKNVHKVVVPYKPQGSAAFTADEITKVLVYLVFKSSRSSYGPFEGSIEAEEKNQISFIVPEEVRGQTGTVEIYIMLNLTDDRQVDLGKFTATARISAVDSDAPEMQKYYLPMYEDLVADIEVQKENFEAASIYSKAEVDSKVNPLVIGKADKTYVDSMLSSIAQGGPRELFYSLAALKAKYPNGADGTYLVFDSATTDGAHSYMWDTGAKSWKDIGVYQAFGLADGSVTLPKIGFNPFNVVRYEHLNFEERKIGYDKNACLTLNEELSGRALHSYQIQINKTGDMVRACKIYFRLETSSDSARVYFAPYDQNDIVVANLLGFSTNDIRIDYYRVKEGVLSQNIFTSVPLNTTFDAVKNGFSITLAISGGKLLTYFNDKLVSVNDFPSLFNGEIASAGIALRGSLNANSHIERAKVASVTNPYMFFSLDDTISILKDLTENATNYTSIFNNSKLSFLKSMHDAYGAVFTLLLFNEDSDGWNISSTTNKFQLEFSKNSHWLKFGFHSQKAGVNYGNSTGSDFIAAYSLCMTQIRRFANDANIDTIPRIENFSASKTAQIALKNQYALFSGLHGADDSRASNAGLSGSELSLLQTNDDYYDIENDLYYLRSETRLDGKASADVTTLLNNQYYDVNNNRIYNMFFHETTLQNLSTQGAIRAAAQWAFDKHIRFDFPQNNKPVL